MKTVFFLGLILTSSVSAEIIKSRIHSIEDGLIKFENGRVAFFDSQSPGLEAQDFVKAEVDEKSNLKKFEILPSLSQREFENTEVAPTTENPAPAFEATVVPSMEEAWNIFNRSNPFYKRVSECSDRAHVWAHDEFKRTGTKSKKAFVFFTKSYIDSVRFKWWFHVAPMYTVNDNGTQKELVMDYRFTDRPMTVKEWTDHFVYTKRPCKVTTKFSEYDVNPQTENCYLIFESMHYRLPVEIFDQERKGIYKTTTTEAELKNSFRWAFDRSTERE